MPERFNNKLRISSVRLQGYDYGADGAYFITVCIKDRLPQFGRIKIQHEPVIELSPIGQITEKYWREIPNHFPFVQLDVFQIMPDHLHGIVIIQKSEDLRIDERHIKYQNKFGSQSKNISSIIRGFKAAVKKWAVMNKIDFNWQERFHDRIVRDDEEFKRIQLYILSNIKNWIEKNKPQT